MVVVVKIDTQISLEPWEIVKIHDFSRQENRGDEDFLAVKIEAPVPRVRDPAHAHDTTRADPRSDDLIDVDPWPEMRFGRFDGHIQLAQTLRTVVVSPRNPAGPARLLAGLKSGSGFLSRGTPRVPPTASIPALCALSLLILHCRDRWQL